METAATHISKLFLELLEQQFQRDDQPYIMNLRYPAQFADKLNIHVNHLNRSLKESFNKTTTELISERILLEAKFLLSHRNWRVFEIAYALGFNESTHFNNFFKNQIKLSPTAYRKVKSQSLTNKSL